MEIDRADGCTPNQLRLFSCSRNNLHRAYGSASWSQGDTKVLPAVHGPKLEQKRMKILRSPALKLFGSLKLDKLVVHDDGALLPCAINAACSVLVDAGIPMKHLAESGYVILGPTKSEEQKMKAFAYLVFPNSVLSVLRKGLSLVEGEPMEHEIITSVTHHAVSVDDLFLCLK